MANWGIIGLGTIANTFASDLKLVPNATLKAVASRSLAKAITFRDTHKADISYDNYQKLANDPDIDIVYIATPHIFHFENSKMCLERGKAVLCEKPMGMNAAQTQKLCNIAKVNNTLLMEGMWTAFLPNFNYLKQLVINKKYGAIKNLQADFCFLPPTKPSHRLINKSLGGGTILDIGIYNVFVCLELLGVPRKITAIADISPTGIDLSCDAVFTYNNTIAKLKSSFKENSQTQLNIEFENGSAVLGPSYFRPSNLKIHSSSGNEELKKHSKGHGYQLEAIHFQDLYLKSKLESPIMPHSKSIQLAKYLDLILEKTGIYYE